MNYKAAAKELYIANTTLAAHIAALEAEIGVPLICKRTSGISLTASGKLFLSSAQKELDAIERLCQECRDIAERITPLRISSFSSSNFEKILWDASMSFREKHPDMTIDITTVPTLSHGSETLTCGDVDIALFSYFRAGATIKHPHLEPQYEYVYLYTDQTRFVIMEGHPLFKKDVIYPEDLEDADLLCVDGPGWNNFHQQAYDFFATASVSINLKVMQINSYYDYCYFHDTEAVKVINDPSLKRYGLQEDPRFRIFDIKGLPMYCDRFAIYDSENFPEAALRFIDELKEYVKEVH